MANLSRKTLTLAAGLVLSVMSANAQQMREGYVDFGTNSGSEKFHELLKAWTPGNQVTADDNFFISRVKPRARFRNEATQVRLDLNEKNDGGVLYVVVRYTLGQLDISSRSYPSCVPRHRSQEWCRCVWCGFYS